MGMFGHFMLSLRLSKIVILWVRGKLYFVRVCVRWGAC